MTANRQCLGARSSTVLPKIRKINAGILLLTRAMKSEHQAFTGGLSRWAKMAAVPV
nr:MAG TPA: hypothetical protein [Caudoviricetes sp.]